MNADRTHLDATILDAIEEHAAALDVAVPDFAVLIAVRHRRTRRTLAAATAAVALLGVGGVVVATNRTEAPSDAVSSEGPSAAAEPTTTPIFPLPAPTVTTVPESVSVEYSCTDPIGQDQLGRQLFGSCDPTPGDIDGDYACDGRIRSEEGFVIFSRCDPVGQLGALPSDNVDAPIDDAEEIHVGSYTITNDDTTRIGVADKFCVGVQALDAANLETNGYDLFYPGLVIVIPPSSNDTC